MKLIKKLTSSARMIKVLIVVCLVVIVFSGVNFTRAMLTYYSDSYVSGTEMYQIGVSLIENDIEVSRYDDDQVTLFIPEIPENDLQLGKTYKEELKVKNCGGNLSDQNAGIDQYVRVIVHKRWLKVDEDGSVSELADTTLNPDFIDLNFVNINDDYWIEDISQATKEQRVFYYHHILKANEESELFANTIRIDPAIVKEVKTETTEADDGTIITTYLYDDYKFEIYVEVDAVQTHNAKEAILSAWGVDVTINEDKTLSLGGGK